MKIGIVGIGYVGIQLAVCLGRKHHVIGLDLDAAGSKWNFLPFTPGLVGGHCVGVDPYYLTHKAQMVGYESEVILAGRRINDSMAQFVGGKTMKLMAKEGIAPSEGSVNRRLTTRP